MLAAIWAWSIVESLQSIEQLGKIHTIQRVSERRIFQSCFVEAVRIKLTFMVITCLTPVTTTLASPVKGYGCSSACPQVLVGETSLLVRASYMVLHNHRYQAANGAITMC